jgi:hypothetical protein
MLRFFRFRGLFNRQFVPMATNLNRFFRRGRMNGARKTRLTVKNAPPHFKTMVQSDVPQGRNGKHKWIVTAILKDLDNLRADSALKGSTGRIGGVKRKSSLRVESCNSEGWAQSCDRQRRHFFVCMDRERGLEKLRKANKKGRRGKI